jgi:anti-anti-sigma regulatory factor
MATSYQPTVTGKAQGTIIFPVNLDRDDANQLARYLARQPRHTRPQFVVDCGTLKCLRTLGVSHVVSQLLVLHRSGASIWLRNVDPVLKRCLHVLRLESLFLITD